MNIDYDALAEILVPKILSRIRSKSKPVETIPVRQDLTGITSIPCYDTTGGQFKNVLVSVNSLKEPAITAGADASEAAEKANTSAAAADEAAARVTDAILDLSEDKEYVRSVVESESARVSAEAARVSAENARTASEEDRADAESGRVSSENTRKTNESARISAEAARVSAENVRTASEEGRADAESVRISNENTRKSNESARISAEAARVSAENARTASEEDRTDAESVRISNENTRKTNESARISAEAARVSAENVRTASEEGRADAESVRISNENTRKSNESARISAEAARVRAEKNRVSAESERESSFSDLKAESEAATDLATEVAEHPTYIGTDNYVYEWDKTSKTYNKTSIYVRGESFSISKVYSSFDEMDSDSSSVFKEGDFCLINTGSVEDPDNAKLYVRSSAGAWDYLVDMSGAIGFTGKTPQLVVGSVSGGDGLDSCSVTMTSGGVDSDGNPIYKINYVVPGLSYDDLTDSQISELQKPANDMIVVLQETNNDIQASEELREVAETMRASAEEVREDAESVRTSNENTRNSNESARASAEIVRVSAENIRAKSEDDRTAAESIRVSNENTRKSSETARASAETDRVEAENDRISNENIRKSNESARASAEVVRVSAENTRKSNETVRVSAESARVAAEQERESDFDKMKVEITKHPYIGENKHWWIWSSSDQAYVDTNIFAEGGFLFPTFHVSDEMELTMISSLPDDDVDFILQDGNLLIVR